MTGKNTDLRKELDALKKKAESAFGRKLPDAAGADLFKPVGRFERSDMEPPRAIGEISPSCPADGYQPGISGPSGSLEELVSGVMTRAGEGSFYRVMAGAETLWEKASTVHAEYLQTLAGDLAAAGEYPAGRKELDDLKPLLEARPEDICYLDIETTGLSNTPLFLVGLMYSESPAGTVNISETGGTAAAESISVAGDRRLVLDLLFARDYTEERMVLLFLAGIFERFTTLVTFNGIRFDMPFIMERMAAHRIACAPPAVHVDLLRVARRAVGKKTPNHKLQTLEVFLLGRKRKGDIPGSRIPGAYHEFVRTGDAGEMAAVIHHNRLDLYSMLELVTLFLSGR